MTFFKFCFVHAINSFIVRCFRKTVCQEMRGSPVWNHFQKVRKCVCEVQQVVSQPHVCVKTQLIAECLLCRVLVKHCGNTSNAVNHLRIHHQEIYQQIQPSLAKKKKKTAKRQGCSKLLDEMDCDTCDAVGNEISCFSFFFLLSTNYLYLLFLSL